MTDPGTDPEEVIRQSYRELTGSVPGGIERRLELAAATERLGSVAAVEAMRRALIMDNPLGLKHGQIVHFTQLVGLGKVVRPGCMPGPRYAQGRHCRS